MSTPDMNVLKVMEDQKTVHNISNRQFALSIDMDPSNLTKIKKADKKTRGYGFTLEQIQKIGVIYNVDMNYIFGLSTEMYRKKGVTSNVTLRNIKAKETSI